MGFLPYWQLESAKYIKPELLSEINYFSLDVDSDGTIKDVVNGEKDPGHRGWENKTVKDLMIKSHIYGTQFTVTIAALDNTVIENVLDSPKAQDTLITQIIELVKTNNLDGVNIDFEYSGTPDKLHQRLFTEFSQMLSTKLKEQVPNAKLSLSIMPLSGRSEDLFDFPKLAPLYDRFIGMSYDFYGEHADIAGPVAPMKGFKEGIYFFDVETMYEDLTKLLPRNKIIMGVPYYGWDWAVTDGKVKNSTTLSGETSYAAVISYARGRVESNLKSEQCFWDRYALESWCWYTDTNKTDHQVWLMDNKAIQTRFDYAKTQNLAGIGIWTLGYDQHFEDLWGMIRNKYSK